MKKNIKIFLHKLLILLKNEKVQAGLIILISTVVFLYPITLKGEIIVSDVYLRFSPFDDIKPQNLKFDSDLRSDMIDSYYPKRRLFFDAIKGGEFSYWENNLKFGVPTNNILDSYFPFEYLGLVVPMQYVLTLIVFIKVFLCGYSTYILLRNLKLKHSTSMFGAIVYMYSGFNIVWFWNNAGTSGFLLPLFLLCVIKILKGRYSYAFLLMYMTAALMLTGFISGVGYILYLCAAYTFVHMIRMYVRKRKSIKVFAFVKPYFILLFSIVIGVSMTIFVLVPTTKYLSYQNVYSYRAAANANYHLDLQTSFPQLIMPYYNGGPLIGSYVGGVNYNEASGYIGLIGVVFFFIGLFFGVKERKWWVIFFTVINLLSISVVYKVGPFLGMINKFPIFNSSSNTRLLMWIAFSASMICAFGFDRLPSIFNYLKANKKRTSQAIILIIAFALLVGSAVGYKLSSFSLQDQKQEVSPSFYRLVIILFSTLLVGGFSIAIVILGYKNWKLKSVPYLFIFIAFIELFIYGQKQIASLPNNLFYPKTPGIEFLQKNTSQTERVMAFDGTFALRGTEAYYGLSIINDHNLYSEMEKKQITKLYKDESLMWMSKTSPRNEPNNVRYDSPEMDEFNIKYLIFAPEQEFSEESKKALEDNFKLVYYDAADLKIYENKGGYSLTHSDNQTAVIKIMELSNNKEKFEIVTDKAATFYVSESYYPNWKAKVNGEDVEILKHEDLFRSVKVDSGKSIIEFEFVTEPVYKYGLIYTIVINIFILSVGLYALRFKIFSIGAKK